MSDARTDSFTRLHQAPALVCAFVAFLAGCQSSEGAAPPASPIIDGGSADTGADVSDASDASPTVLNITLSPKALTPAFSPAIHDYYVRCTTGSNPATLDVKYSSGDQAMPVVLVENQELVVAGQYWIRCVPHDFPPLTVGRASGGPTPGWYLLNSITYAIVLDTNGTPVWYAAGTGMVNLDSPGPNTLSFMPNSTAPYGTSSSSKYEINALAATTTSSVMAVGTPTDGHDLRLLANGNHLLLTYPIESHVDLTGLQAFGSDETIADCQVQEVDPSGNLVWSWLATDHVDPVQESLEPAANMINGVSVVDVFHFNSIEVDTSGNLLLSSRHANALFYVDRPSGTVEWKLGGTAYNKAGATHIKVVGDSQTTFNMQHDARLRSNGDITLFDDHGADSTGVARAVEYSIDHGTNTASVVFQYLAGAQSKYEGSFRRYTDGSSVIGWGYIPSDPRVLTEIDENGNDVFDVALGSQVSYRALKVPPAQLDIGMMRATAGS